METFEKLFVDVHAAGGLSRLTDRLAKEGLASFELPSNTPDALLEIASSIGAIVPHRDSDARGVTTIAATVSGDVEGYHGFSHEGLHLHTDRSGVCDPPTLILMLYRTCAVRGGESILLDGSKLFELLERERPSLLLEALRPGCVRFGGDGEPITTSIFTHLTETRVAVRFRDDELAEMSPMLTDAMPWLTRTMEELSIEFQLHAGQGYAVQNWRWLHGRRQFIGHREAYRILLDVAPTSPIKRGFAVGSARKPASRPAMRKAA